MYKKFLFFLVAASCLVVGFYFYSLKNFSDLHAKKSCAFCDTEVLNYQKFYEDDLVLALFTHKPFLLGHCLIIPKRHVERFEILSDEEITQIGRVIKKVNRATTQVFKTTSYLLLQKNGIEVGQSVPHVHFHYIPRESGDGSNLKFLVKMYIVNALKPISHVEMQKMVEKMKEAMESI